MRTGDTGDGISRSKKSNAQHKRHTEISLGTCPHGRNAFKYK